MGDVLDRARDTDPDRLDWPEYVERGRRALAERDRAQWTLGDLAAAIEVTYGEGDLQRYAAEVGVEYRTLLDYRRVALAFESSERSEGLTWSHHQVIAQRPDRLDLLARASADGWSVAHLRQRMPQRQTTMPLDAIRVGARLRGRLDDGTVRSLAESIARVGLLQPIAVNPEGRLLAGWHRLEACRLLGWREIPITTIDPLALPVAGMLPAEAVERLIEIADNLHRDPLNALERAELEAARARLLSVEADSESAADVDPGSAEQAGNGSAHRDPHDLTAAATASRPAAPAAGDARRVMDAILADGEWHARSELLQAGMPRIDPGPAIRYYRRRHRRPPGGWPESGHHHVSGGAFAIVKDSIASAVKAGSWEREGSGVDARFRATPKLLRRLTNGDAS